MVYIGYVLGSRLGAILGDHRIDFGLTSPSSGCPVTLLRLVYYFRERVFGNYDSLFGLVLKYKMKSCM